VYLHFHVRSEFDFVGGNEVEHVLLLLNVEQVQLQRHVGPVEQRHLVVAEDEQFVAQVGFAQFAFEMLECLCSVGETDVLDVAFVEQPLHVAQDGGRVVHEHHFEVDLGVVRGLQRFHGFCNEFAVVSLVAFGLEFQKECEIGLFFRIRRILRIVDESCLQLFKQNLHNVESDSGAVELVLVFVDFACEQTIEKLRVYAVSLVGGFDGKNLLLDCE